MSHQYTSAELLAEDVLKYLEYLQERKEAEKSESLAAANLLARFDSSMANRLLRVAYVLADDNIKPSKCPWCCRLAGEDEDRTEHIPECAYRNLVEALNGIEV
jgi:hypothetical protein